ncbi:hypothetical protein ACFRCI_44255 [Streptomyces sp. NPDC056638]|uniref:hypothetical protein n=1 Tax=Streptomyces sp. NPDC056638 TaxID=3345887 RepID=UPI00368248B6
MNDRTDARQGAGQRIRALLGPDGELCRSALCRDAARSRSPKLHNPVADSPAPNAHTEAEPAALIGLLTVPRPRIRSVAVGHGRDAKSRIAAVCPEFGDTYLARIVGAREVQPVPPQQVQVARAGAVVAKAPATMAQALVARLTG